MIWRASTKLWFMVVWYELQKNHFCVPPPILASDLHPCFQQTTWNKPSVLYLLTAAHCRQSWQLTGEHSGAFGCLKVWYFSKELLENKKKKLINKKTESEYWIYIHRVTRDVTQNERWCRSVSAARVDMCVLTCSSQTQSLLVSNDSQWLRLHVLKILMHLKTWLSSSSLIL